MNTLMDDHRAFDLARDLADASDLAYHKALRDGCGAHELARLARHAAA